LAAARRAFRFILFALSISHDAAPALACAVAAWRSPSIFVYIIFMRVGSNGQFCALPVGNNIVAAKAPPAANGGV
jgi:hypothetical protein